MNENLQNALAGIITKAVETVDNATVFIMGELPDIASQYLQWRMFDYTFDGMIFMFFAILLVVVFPSIVVKAKRDALLAIDIHRNIDTRPFTGNWAVNSRGELLEGAAIATFFSVVVGMGLAVNALLKFKYALKVIIAPKLVLIEWAATLVK